MSVTVFLVVLSSIKGNMDNKYQEVMEGVRDVYESIRKSEAYLQDHPDIRDILEIVEMSKKLLKQTLI